MEEDKVLDLLEAADWEEIILRLTRYAMWRSRRYTWQSGDSSILPGGKTPEDIACDAIHKVWQGTRTWDPEKYPNLLTHLMWIVNSDLEHLYSSMEHKIVRRVQKPGDEQTITNINDDPMTTQVFVEIQNPEEELISREQQIVEQRVKNALYKLVKGEDDLEMLLLCIEEGIDKPEVIAVQMGWEVSKVNNLKKKLLRRTTKISEILKKDEWEEKNGEEK